MFGRIFQRQRVGRPISARAINGPQEAVERMGRMHVAPPLELSWFAGVPFLRSQRIERISVKLGTSYGAGKYAWTQQIETSGGGWSDGARTDGGVDFAWEFNGNAGLAVGTKVELKRDRYTGEFRFQLDSCP